MHYKMNYRTCCGNFWKWMGDKITLGKQTTELVPWKKSHHPSSFWTIYRCLQTLVWKIYHFFFCERNALFPLDRTWHFTCMRWLVWEKMVWDLRLPWGHYRSMLKCHNQKQSWLNYAHWTSLLQTNEVTSSLNYIHHT